MNVIKTDSKSRIAALKKMLQEGIANTQEEICEELKKMNFDITQSTVSRDLRRLGAMRMVNSQGEISYRLSGQVSMPTVVESVSTGSLSGLIKNIQHNGAVIVIHTSPGSASLIAKHIDEVQGGRILGTIAGDDTIFVVPAETNKINQVVLFLKQEFEITG